MKNRLFGLLTTFDPKELKQFKKFINSEFFNTDKKVSALYSLLFENALKKKKLDDKYQIIIYNKLYPENKCKEKHLVEPYKGFLVTKISLLTQLAKKFLVVQELLNNSVYFDTLMYEKLLEKQQNSLFESALKKGEKALNKQNEKGIQYYYHKYQTERIKLHYTHFQQNSLLNKYNLKHLNQSLDLFYLLNKLDFYATALSADKEDLHLYENILNEFLKLPEYTQNRLVHANLIAIDLAKNFDAAKFFELFDLLEKHESSFTKQDLNGFYKIGVNFCVKKINSGNLEFHNIHFDIWKKIEAKELLVENNKLVPLIKLKTLILAACNVKEFDWAKTMVKKYSRDIEANIRQSVLNFNLAIIHFAEKDFGTAHSFLIDTDLIPAYEVHYRILQMKSFYETNLMFEYSTEQLFKSQLRFFQNKKELSKNSRVANSNFTKTLISLYRVKHQLGVNTSKKIKTRLNGFELVSDRNWLIEKLSELE